jgi:hypothetical protein
LERIYNKHPEHDNICAYYPQPTAFSTNMVLKVMKQILLKKKTWYGLIFKLLLFDTKTMTVVEGFKKLPYLLNGYTSSRWQDLRY